MAFTVADRVRVVTATTGTGPVVLGAAVAGFRSFASAGIQSGSTTSYTIEDGVNWECGVGTYTASGSTFARTTVYASSNGNAPINLSGNAQIYISLLAETLPTASGGSGAPSAYNTQALPYSATVADKGTVINPTGTGVLSLPAATAVSGWYAYVKKRDDGGAATLTPASGTVDGLASIVAYKEEFIVYYDAAASTAAGTPVYRTQGRQRGWIDFGNFSVTSGTASVTITAGAGDPEIRDLELDIENYVPSASGNLVTAYLQGATNSTTAGQSVLFNGTTVTAAAIPSAQQNLNINLIATALQLGVKLEFKGVNSSAAYGTRIGFESNFSSFMQRRMVVVSSAGTYGSITFTPSTGTITSMLYNVRLYRP